MPELRYNRLNNTWVIISKERAKRPHDYPVEWRKEVGDPAKCPFDLGKENLTPPEVYAVREPGTKPNTPGWKIRVIPNKYPALKPEEPFFRESEDIHDRMGGFGYHEVIIDTPDHFRQFHNFTVSEIQMILYVYRERMKQLYQNENIYYVQIFKNHGKEAGKSLYHSHSQLVALPRIPRRVDTQISQCRKYYKEKERCLLCDEIRYELKQQIRIVYDNYRFTVYTPFASAFPFEMKIVPKFHSSDFTKTTDEDLTDLAEALFIAVRKLSKLFENPPFNMILHTSPPFREIPWDPNYFYNINKMYHWYIEILPRMAIHAGFELGTEFFINPTPPEEAAKYLREKKIEEG